MNKAFVSQESLFAFCVIVLLVTAFFGPVLGYSVNGIEYGLSSSDATTATPVEWVADSLGFMWNLISFQIDGMPYIITIIFQFISIMLAYLGAKLIRGS